MTARETTETPACSATNFHTMRTVVAFAGCCGASKDAAADVLCRHLGFRNMKLSQPLKDAVCELFDLPAASVADRELKDAQHAVLLRATLRSLLQWLGTDVMQHGLSSSGLLPGIGRGFWARRLISAIDALPASADRIVISDLRFAHELELLRARYGQDLLAIRLIRGGDGARAGQLEHESESSVDGVDADVDLRNDGTLERLEATVLRLIEERTNVGPWK